MRFILPALFDKSQPTALISATYDSLFQNLVVPCQPLKKTLENSYQRHIEILAVPAILLVIAVSLPTAKLHIIPNPSTQPGTPFISSITTPVNPRHFIETELSSI